LPRDLRQREMSREAGVSSNEPRHPSPGYSLAAAISQHVVRLFSEYTGRGPTRARTMMSDNMIVCITHDTLTKGERRLVADGEAELVVSIRRTFQQTMREDLVSGIELLTGRKVLSFMSDHDADHDYAAEVFILDAAPGERTRSAQPETRLES
jgi:uncharacterized protein YbcI